VLRNHQVIIFLNLALVIARAGFALGWRDTRYILDFERLLMQTSTARELYDEMPKLYPDWSNPGAL